MLSKELTIELKEILQTEFKKEVSIQEAEKIGKVLLSYSGLLSKMAKEITNNLNKDKNEHEGTDDQSI